MVPFFVVVGFLMLGGAIVAWATRPAATFSYVEKRERPATRPVLAAHPDDFYSPPVATPPMIVGPVVSPTPDPFAHAPALSDLGDAPLEMRK